MCFYIFYALPYDLTLISDGVIESVSWVGRCRILIERLIHSVSSKRNMLSTVSLTLFYPLIRIALRLFRIFSQKFQYQKIGLRRTLLSRSSPNTSTSKKKRDLANFLDSFLASAEPTGISRERVSGGCYTADSISFSSSRTLSDY